MNCKKRIESKSKKRKTGIIFSYLILFGLMCTIFFSFTCRFTSSEMYTYGSIDAECVLCVYVRRCCYFSSVFISVGFNYVLNWTLLRCLSNANFHALTLLLLMFVFTTGFHVIFSHDHLSFSMRSSRFILFSLYLLKFTTTST